MPDLVARTLQQRGARVPTFIYGTAWKEGQTQALTEMALSAGFLGIDTANQRRHYFESGVGKAVRNILDQGKLKRSDLFLQTKFTYAAGQDHRLPFDPDADYPEQVRQSLSSSLDHLQTEYVDSFILHGPATLHGFGRTDRTVWRAMEQLHKEGTVRLIGVSNIGRDQLAALLEFADVAPAFVQNRCFARDRWDAEIRSICRANDVIYQGFSLLTANRSELNHPRLHEMAGGLRCSPFQLVFRFCLQAGIVPLTGTTSRQHMQEDLAVYTMTLSAEQTAFIENIAHQ